jgi:phosphatidate cytidylyltransferase
MATTTEDESTAGDNVRRSPRKVAARRRKAKGNNNAHASEQSPFFVKTDEEEMEEEENGAAPAHALADSTQKAPTGTLNGHASANGSNDPQLAAALATPLLTELPSSKRIRDFTVRFVFTWLMLGGFFLVLAYGPFAVSLLVLGVQILVFREVIAIAHVPNKEKKLPWFRALNWFFLLVTNYYLYGETMFTHFQRSVTVDAFLQPLATHHRFVSFILYCVLLIYFVMNLKKGHYKFQFLQFFWTHMTLLVVVLQSHFIISSIFEGLIWFLLPVLLVVTNDIMAYVGGFFFGKTRLIKLSPKKTWVIIQYL